MVEFCNQENIIIYTCGMQNSGKFLLFDFKDISNLLLANFL